jgi:hypothetical protein
VEGDIRETLMPLGFQHGDGWFDLIWRLCERLEPVVTAAQAETGRPFQVLQVKEKFGGLRFSPNYKNDAISALIEAAEIESFHTCEVCGQPVQRRGDSWLQTTCDEHLAVGREAVSRRMALIGFDQFAPLQLTAPPEYLVGVQSVSPRYQRHTRSRLERQLRDPPLL